jgi:replication-associated recombination protein RarA
MQHHATLVHFAKPLHYVPTTTIDFVAFVHVRLGINEVRDITTAAQLRPVAGDQQLFIIQPTFITHEAQNALLKLFEEPPLGLLFELVVPPAFQLLPTLMSRIGVVIATGDETDIDPAFAAFVEASYADRLKQIEAWHKGKDADWLQAMAAGVHSLRLFGLPVPCLAAVQLVGGKLATRGASNKMLLEHLALALPLRK